MDSLALTKMKKKGTGNLKVGNYFYFYSWIDKCKRPKAAVSLGPYMRNVKIS